ncbi:MAG: TspO/MBR family protein [Hyphomicrobium sp.]
MTALASSRLGVFAVAGFAAAIVMMINGLATEHGAWTASLARPDWSPPSWLFGPVWGVLFVLIALAAERAWHALPNARARATLVQLFVVNGVINALWSPLFFVARRPDFALIDIALLWLSIAALIVFLMRTAQSAALLLLPYLAWVTIACALNAEIVRLNAPFEGAAFSASQYLVTAARLMG